MRISEEEILKLRGLKIGDIIKFKDENQVVEIKKLDNNIYLEDENGKVYSLIILIYLDFELVVYKKSYGELRCSDFKSCSECPLCNHGCIASENDNLYTTCQKIIKEKEKELEDIKLIMLKLDKIIE